MPRQQYDDTRRPRLRPLSLACAVLMLSVSAHATTLRPMDVSELIDRSELIFTGVAIDRQVATSRDGRYPFTFITFNVQSVLKGDVDGSQLTLRFEGGDIGDEHIEVVGMPRFDRDASYLLFVADNGKAISPVVGWSQGQFELLDHPSRPDAKVIVDRDGMAVGGIRAGRFLRTPVERDGRSVRYATRAPRGVVVLNEDGVVITVPSTPDLTKTETELAPASLVFGSLRTAMAKRLRGKHYRPGARVRSLTVDDVPATFSLVPKTDIDLRRPPSKSLAAASGQGGNP